MKAALLAGVLLVAACAAPRGTDDALERARAAYQAAQSDPQVTLRAAGELEAAARTLEQAQQARANDAQAGQDRQAALQARLKRTEEERDRALAAAKEAEAARDASDRLSAEVRRLQAQVAQLEAEQTQRGWILTLGSDLLFDSGRASLKVGGRRALANLARFMRQHPERKIAIEGFTDDRGSPAFTQRLSERRAEAVREALVHDGIRAERIEARGRGSAYPVATNSNAQGRQLNRRVEILIGEGPGRAATGGTLRR